MSGSIESSPNDEARVLVVILSTVVAVVGSIVGSGALVGTPISQVADGALAADATAVAPGRACLLHLDPDLPRVPRARDLAGTAPILGNAAPGGGSPRR